ncbi:MAG: PAS domain S-box protein [Rhodanobacteraceae bacterium]
MRAKHLKPRVDRGQLQQIIAGLTEGVLLIDPDGSIVRANDAALAMHACEHAEDLGATATGYRKRFVLRYLNHHLLKAKQYPLARVLAGDQFDDVTVEVTHRSDDGFRRVQQLRSLILVGANGAVESLVLIGKDVTERLSAEDRFERTFGANPAPAIICRLSDTRYIKVNQGFVEMTGFDRDDIIGRPFRELDVLHDAEYREDAMLALREHRTIAQQEAVLRVRDGSGKFVIVAGQPIEIDDEACMLFTFNDLDARKQAEVSLMQSEERFAKAFRLAPVPMLVCAQSGWRVLAANAAFAAVSGHELANLLGQSIQDIGFWKGTEVLGELRSSLHANREIRDRDVTLLTRDGATIDCLLSAEAMTIQGEACVLCVVRDITVRKRSEMDLLAAIEAVMKDTSWFSRTVMEKLAQIRRPGNADGVQGNLGSLTPREREVLGLICKGQTDAEIAAALQLSRNTVRNHVSAVYARIGVNRRSAAVVWGRERGLAAY